MGSAWQMVNRSQTLLHATHRGCVQVQSEHRFDGPGQRKGAVRMPKSSREVFGQLCPVGHPIPRKQVSNSGAQRSSPASPWTGPGYCTVPFLQTCALPRCGFPHQGQANRRAGDATGKVSRTSVQPPSLHARGMPRPWWRGARSREGGGKRLQGEAGSSQKASSEEDKAPGAAS